MRKKIHISQLLSAVVKTVKGDTIAALQTVTGNEQGHHETTSVFGVVTVVATPEDARKVAMGECPINHETEIDKPESLSDKMKFAGGHGLFSAMETDGHKIMRKPASVLASGVGDDLPDLNDEAIRLAEKLGENDWVQIYPSVREFASRVAMCVFFGVDPDNHQEDVAALGEAFAKGEHAVFKRVLGIDRSTDALLLNGDNDSLAKFNAFLDSRIAEYKGKPEGEDVNDNVLSRLIEANGGAAAMTSDAARIEVKEQICQILMAGIQSTSSGLSWLLHDIARHRDVQKDLREHIAALMEDGSVNIKESRLPEIAQIMDESLRLHSVVPLTLPRSVSGNKEVTVVSLSAIHHDARNFSNPETFDPSRMSDENREKRADGSFIPFFVGAHACPGQILYKTAAATALTHVVHRLEISAPDVEYPAGRMGISNAPDMDAKLKFQKLEIGASVRLQAQPVLKPEPSTAPAVNPPPGCPYHNPK